MVPMGNKHRGDRLRQRTIHAGANERVMKFSWYISMAAVLNERGWQLLGAWRDVFEQKKAPSPRAGQKEGNRTE
jgi:hypothetical protein